MGGMFSIIEFVDTRTMLHLVALSLVLLATGCTATNPATSCAYSETSPQKRTGDAYCAVTVGVGECWKRPCAGDKLVSVMTDDLDLDLLMTPSNEPPSVAFSLTLRAPTIDCPLTGGSWVTDDGGTIAAHIYCGGYLIAFTAVY